MQGLSKHIIYKIGLLIRIKEFLRSK